MTESTRKSFYVFLSMVLGVLLFLMLQRAAFLVAFLVGANVGSIEAQALSVVTSAIAVSFGAWYGIWLGLLWYRAVYEERSVRSLLHSTGVVSFFRGLSKDGKWEIDDVAATSVSPDGSRVSKLEYFEANTVKFGGAPASGGVLASRMVKAKAPARNRRKPASKKSVS